MGLTFRKLHQHFAAEASPIDLRQVHDPETLAEIRAGMDEHAVLVFRDQKFGGTEQLEFAERFDGALHRKTGVSALGKNRLGDEALTDISNVDENGAIRRVEDRRRMYSLANRLWHTDASFQDPPGRYSLLFACVIPPVRADTEFADMRAAYDALPAKTKREIEGLVARHSAFHSRVLLGDDRYTSEQLKVFPAVDWPLVRVHPGSGRKVLFVGAHCSEILGMTVPEGRVPHSLHGYFLRPCLVDRLRHHVQRCERPRPRRLHRRSRHAGRRSRHAKGGDRERAAREVAELGGLVKWRLWNAWDRATTPVVASSARKVLLQRLPRRDVKDYVVANVRRLGEEVSSCLARPRER